MVIATKVKNGKTISRQFSPLAWKLLGSNKEGWTAVDSQAVTSNVKTKPDNGEKKVEETKKPVVEKTVSNLKEEKVEKVESNLQTGNDNEKSELAKLQEECEAKNIAFNLGDSEEVLKELIAKHATLSNEEKKVEFMKEANKIKRAAIKDYFDKNSIKYDNKAKEEELQEQLSVVFENDLQALKLVF